MVPDVASGAADLYRVQPVPRLNISQRNADIHGMAPEELQWLLNERFTVEHVFLENALDPLMQEIKYDNVEYGVFEEYIPDDDPWQLLPPKVRTKSHILGPPPKRTKRIVTQKERERQEAEDLYPHRHG